MPHLILEYSANLASYLNPPALFQALHEALLATGAFQLADLKSRAVRLDEFCVGDGDPRHAFVHLRIAVLEGRAPELQQRIGEVLLEALAAELDEAQRHFACQLCVELQELRRDLYFKRGPAD
ncbi:MAG TPA: 5-carboxymethyl-2-hydroxymuconate Delta-isomerase [Nevskiales bacterium]|nr:5-carboxymethyl-2-hydroxymuconate Delta-isomerase [Nevskiales bacterium]